MPYDPHTVNQIRQLLARHPAVSEGRSIGGSLAFMLRGKFCCAVGKDGIMVRIGPEAAPQALKQLHVQSLFQRGKSPAGYVPILQQGLADDAALTHWINQAIAYTVTLKAK